MPLLHVRRFPPSLSPALSSVRSKDCSNRQHNRHLARSCSAADVVPLLPTAGHRRRASSRQSRCPRVCLHEPSRGAPPSERSDERPPSSSAVGHSTAGGPLWSSSGLISASASITRPGAPRRPHKLRPRPLQRPLTGEPPPPTAPPCGALLR
jgi:hypothetical protein